MVAAKVPCFLWAFSATSLLIPYLVFLKSYDFFLMNCNSPQNFQFLGADRVFSGKMLAL